MAVFNSVDRIITTAMRGVGKLQKGDNPDATDYLDYTPVLIDLVNLWMTQGLKLWLNSLVTVPLVNGTATYNLGPAGAILTIKPMRVLEGYFVYANGSSYPLTVLSWNEYNILSNTSQKGALNSYFVNKALANIPVTFYLVPDAAAALGTAQLLVQTNNPNYVDQNSVLNFPQEWYMPLVWGLAAEIGVGQPKSVLDEAIRKADKYRAMLEDWDVEDASTSFSPTMGASESGRFK